MPSEIERYLELSGRDRQRRTRFTATEASIDPEEAVSLLYMLWARRYVLLNATPTVAQFEPDITALNESSLSIFSVDTDFSDPLNFRFSGHIESPLAIHGAALDGRRVCEFPSKIHRQALAREYAFSVQESLPRYDEIDQVLNGWIRHYRRCMVPVTDEHGRVVKLFYAVRRVSPSRPSAAAILFSNDM